MYNPPRNALSSHLVEVSGFLDFHSSSYSNIIILGDFNVDVEEPYIKFFYESYILKRFLNQSACSKNASWSTCIDLNITSDLSNTCIIETGFSDVHLMRSAVMKKAFKTFQLESYILGHTNSITVNVIHLMFTR